MKPGVDTLSPGFCSSPAVNVARFLLLSLIITIICQYTQENKEFLGAEVCSSLLLTIRKYFFIRSEIAPLFLQAPYCWFWLVFSPQVYRVLTSTLHALPMLSTFREPLQLFLRVNNHRIMWLVAFVLQLFPRMTCPGLLPLIEYLPSI